MYKKVGKKAFFRFMLKNNAYPKGMFFLQHLCPDDIADGYDGSSFGEEYRTQHSLEVIGYWYERDTIDNTLETVYKIKKEK